MTLLRIDAFHVVLELASLLEVGGGDLDLLQLAVHVDVEAVKFAFLVHERNLRAPQHGSVEEGVATGSPLVVRIDDRLDIGRDRP